MALPVYRTAKAPATYGIPGGQAQQNRLYSMLSKNTASADTNPGDTFVWDPNTVFGTYPGGASTDTGQKAGPNVHNTVQTPGTTQPTPGGSQGDAPPATTNNNNNNSNNSNGSDQSAIDFSGDPILARIRALNAQNIANAEASALAARKQAEIGYGYDPNLTYEDQATQDAAKQNTYSTLAQLLSGYQENDRALTEAENKANLFYSGERIRQTGLEGKQYGLQQTQAANTFQGVINQIAQGVLDAKLSAQGQETQGMSDAYTRALQTALANNTGDPNGDPNNPSGPNLKDFDYGAKIPDGYSDEAIYQAALDGAPAGATPMHIMNQGQVQNGMISIKYRMPDGTTNTIWVKLPKGTFTRPTNTNPNPNPTPTSTTTSTTTSTPSSPPARAPQ